MKQAITTVGWTFLSDVWIDRVVKFIWHGAGLTLVIAAVVSATNYKLDSLRTSVSDQSWKKTYTTAEDRVRQLDCLTRNIYWESGKEPFEGKVGVAQVTINRLESGKFADSLCEVVYQKNVFYEKVICQFSWFCENIHRTRAIHKETWNESEAVAKKVLLEGFRLPSLENALFFHATYVSPGWKKEKIATIGNHIFYK